MVVPSCIPRPPRSLAKVYDLIKISDKPPTHWFLRCAKPTLLLSYEERGVPTIEKHQKGKIATHHETCDSESRSIETSDVKENSPLAIRERVRGNVRMQKSENLRKPPTPPDLGYRCAEKQGTRIGVEEAERKDDSVYLSETKEKKIESEAFRAQLEETPTAVTLILPLPLTCPFD